MGDSQRSERGMLTTQRATQIISMLMSQRAIS